MSHRYGERLPPRSQGPLRPSSLSASVDRSGGNAEDADTMQAENDISTKNAIGIITDTGNNRKDASNISLLIPHAIEIDSWTLAQLKGHLEEVVIQKRIASGQARENLETRRLSLIERVTRIERAEERKRDAARRGEMLFLEILVEHN